MDLVRSWKRHVECPTCKAAAGRACRTAGGSPTNEHRARRDAVGPIPYAKWRKGGPHPGAADVHDPGRAQGVGEASPRLCPLPTAAGRPQRRGHPRHHRRSGPRAGARQVSG
ncbi:zinc finger domain-containing protein [Streptomyces erythrochromogenes]